MRRLALIVAFAVVASTATAGTHSFQAQLTAAPVEGHVISSELIWSCTGTTCAARGAMVDVPARLCGRLARDTGPLRSFAVDGVGFDVEQLQTCNARARARLARARSNEPVRLASPAPTLD